MITYLNNNNFQEEITNSNIPVIIDFYADWCGPCKIIAPTLEEISTEYDGKCKVCKVNIDNTQELAIQFGIMSIPTILYFKNGEKVDQTIGVITKEQLIEKINNLL